MNPYIEIAGRKIGQDFPPLVIAEIGINHEVLCKLLNKWSMQQKSRSRNCETPNAYLCG
jgi:hypothetical protein